LDPVGGRGNLDAPQPGAPISNFGFSGLEEGVGNPDSHLQIGFKGRHEAEQRVTFE
jgi:hypothetical protein